MISRIYAIILPVIAVLLVVALLVWAVFKVWTWMAGHLAPEKQNTEQVEHGIFDI